MKTKNALRFHLIPVRKAKVPKQKIINAEMDVERGEYLLLLVGVYTDKCDMESSLEVPQKS